MKYYEVVDAENELLERILGACDGPFSADSVGLDYRVGMLYAAEDYVVAVSPGQADYYGGLEYVDPEYTVAIAGHKVYGADDERVRSILDNYKENQNDDES